MRTIAYVDGYNLYHGRIKHTAYKWLDLRALVEAVLKIQDPLAELVGVKFFTAPIKMNLARKGRDSVNAQDAYHRALQVHGVEVILGRFTLERGTAPQFVEGRPADRDVRVDIWTLGEKQTDVQLALSLYRDVASRHCEQVLLMTNDSDLGPALKAIREDFPGTRIGLVLPRRPDPGRHARQSGTLEGLADWTRHHLLDEELDAHQLPTRVATRKKPIDKPGHW